MDMLKKIFPLSWKYTKDLTSLVIGIVIQLIVGIVAGLILWVAGFLTAIPVLGLILALILRIAGSLVDLYVLVGIILQLLIFFKVIKD